MNESYTYPAIFKYLTKGVEIIFPDLENCFTFCENGKKAVECAKEILSQYVYECDKSKLPKPSDVRNIKLKEDEILIMVDVWLPYYMATLKKSSIKKTLTISTWLNEIAEHNQINFSKVLQEALKEILEVEGPRKRQKGK